MSADAIKSWLAKKKRWGFAQQVLLGWLALVAGLVVLFLTFWLTYAMIWISVYGVSATSELVFGRKLHLAHEWRLAGSAGFVFLLFFQHFRTDPWHWGDYSVVQRAGFSPAKSARGFQILNPRVAFNLAGNMGADILLSGPRLVSGTVTLVRQGLRWRRLDQEGCGVLLAFLLSRLDVVTWEELKSAGWEEWCAQLRSVDGVQFLQKGLMLSGELRSELYRLNRG
jgi:hypothetical protein